MSAKAGEAQNRQKLVIAQAFLGPVGLLVLDEPFSGLDPTSHRALDELTEETQSDGTAVLISSHYVAPEHVGVLQLRIDGGQLVTVSHDEGSRSPDLRVMEVELSPTTWAKDHQQVTSIAGVASTQFQQPEGVLVLRTDHLHIDRVLTTAIALGWSVRSVHDQFPEASSK